MTSMEMADKKKVEMAVKARMIQSKYQDEPITYGQALVTHHILQNPEVKVGKANNAQGSPAKRIIDDLCGEEEKVRKVFQSDIMKGKRGFNNLCIFCSIDTVVVSKSKPPTGEVDNMRDALTWIADVRPAKKQGENPGRW